MRLSAWRSAAPSKEAVAPKVTAAVDAILSLFGAGWWWRAQRHRLDLAL